MSNYTISVPIDEFLPPECWDGMTLYDREGGTTHFTAQEIVDMAQDDDAKLTRLVQADARYRFMNGLGKRKA